MKATERLYHTADRLALVPEGHPDAAFLAYTAGDELSERDAQRLEAAEAEAKAQAEAKAEAEAKAQSKPADKSRKPADNK